jgi:hypothetical protein
MWGESRSFYRARESDKLHFPEPISSAVFSLRFSHFLSPRSANEEMKATTPRMETAAPPRWLLFSQLISRSFPLCLPLREFKIKARGTDELLCR